MARITTHCLRQLMSDSMPALRKGAGKTWMERLCSPKEAKPGQLRDVCNFLQQLGRGSVADQTTALPWMTWAAQVARFWAYVSGLHTVTNWSEWRWKHWVVFWEHLAVVYSSFWFLLWPKVSRGIPQTRALSGRLERELCSATSEGGLAHPH